MIQIHAQVYGIYRVIGITTYVGITSTTTRSWNSLPIIIHCTRSTITFRNKLKNYVQ